MQIVKLRSLLVEPLEARQMLAAASVTISEIMYNPIVTDIERVAGLKDRDLEFIEFTNVGDAPVQLRDNKLIDAVDLTFEQFELEPGQHVVAVNNRQAFEVRYGSQIQIVGIYDGTLGNGGNRLILQDANGQTIQDITYDDAWYPDADGAGKSLVSVDPENLLLDRNVAASWRMSDRIDGSPGYEDGDADPRPANLRYSIQSTTHVQIRWEASAQTNPNLQGYGLYRNGELVGETSETSYLDDGIAPSRRYGFQVAAIHTDGSRHFSSPLIVKTEVIGGDLAFDGPTSQGTVRLGLNEISGMTGSRANENVFWLHNDGPQSVIYAINAEGKLLGTIRLPNIQPRDWEDITLGPGPIEGMDYIYVGDIGGKGPKRTDVVIYRVPEPVVSEGDAGMSYDVASVDVLRLRFPAGSEFNSEALLSDPQTGDLFVIPKLGSGTPIFRAPASQLSANATVELEEVGQIGFPNVSGGDFSPSGNEIVIRTEDLAQLFHRADGQSIADAFLSGPSQLIPVVGRPNEPNGEAITFDHDGQNYFTVSEGENPTLFSFKRVPTALPGDANQDQLFDSSDLVRVFQVGKYETGQPALFSEGDWNGDGLFGTGDLVIAFQTDRFEKPAAAAIASAVLDLLDEDWFVELDIGSDSIGQK